VAQQLAINDVVQLQVVCADGSQAAFNTYHYQVTGVGVAVATLEDMIINFSALVAPKYKVMLYNGATYDGIIGQVISPLPLLARVLYDADGGVGTAGAIGLPKQTSGLIRFQTNFAGPGFRGRAYIPFPSATSNQADGVPTNAYNANGLVLADALKNFIAVSNGGRTATVQMGLFRRAGSIFTPIVSDGAAANWATQKRRGDFGRPNLAPL
jgi:hypothetical protein